MPRLRNVILCILVLASVFLIGCQQQGFIGFAPVGKYLVSWREDEASLPVFGPGYYGWKFYDTEVMRDTYVGVSEVERPNDVQWIKLAHYFPKYGISKHAFSPDGQHLLIGDREEQYILNLQTRQLEELPRNTPEVKLVAWSSGDELVGITYLKTGGARLFHWRLGQAEATEMIGGRPVDTGLLIAPNGRYALAHSRKEGAIRQLNVMDGSEVSYQLPDINGQGMEVKAAAWNKDCSKVLVSLETDEFLKWKTVLVLLDTAGGKMVAAQVLQPEDIHPHSDGMQWTSDQRYVWGLVSWQGPLLVSFSPWQASPFKPSRGYDYQVTPCPGWLVGNDSDGQNLLTLILGISNIHNVVASYDGRTVLPLSDDRYVCFSEDGKLLAEMNDSGSIRVRRLELPPAPAFSPASMPATQSR